MEGGSEEAASPTAGNGVTYRKAIHREYTDATFEGNLPMLTAKKGERVRWYMFANGNADDVHTPHWHGQTVLFNHMHADTFPLTPMGMAVSDVMADNVGAWFFHCHVADHLEGGMQSLFTVLR